MANERLQRLIDHLRTIGGDALRTTGTDIHAAVTEAFAAIPGVESLEQTLERAELAPDAAYQLESIILPRLRPVLDVIGDSYSEAVAPWTHLDDQTYRARFAPAIRAACRVELPGHPQLPYAGTAFLVGERLLMTNRHVAAIFASGLGRREIQLLDGLGPAVDFRRELVPVPPAPVRVVRVRMIHPHWDMALLELAAPPAGRSPMTLAAQPPADLAGREVVVIGYPAQDPRSPTSVQNEVFRSVFNVKRLQPGRIRQASVSVDSFGHQVAAVSHDASTLGGNSGSMVLDASTGSVLALHFAGVYLEANYAVPAWELARDSRVVDTGVRFDGSGSAGAQWLGVWQTLEPAGQPTAAERPLPLLPQADPAGDARRAALAAARAEWTYGSKLAPLAIAAAVPSSERPSLRWAARVLRPAAAVGVNQVKNRAAWLLRNPLEGPLAVATAGAGEQAAHEAVAARAEALLAGAEGVFDDLVAVAERYLLSIQGGGASDPDPNEGISLGGPRGRPSQLADYRELFRGFAAPPVAARGLDDATFVRLRVAGPNPELLQCVDAVPDGFAAALELPGSGETAASAAADGRLFLADYAMLSMLVPGQASNHGRKFVSTPRALFAVAPGTGTLRPVAIQCQDGGPVFRPGDPAWQLAKQVVHVADGNHHELVSHLGRTHLYVEPFIMATHRELAPDHPIFTLLVPHFEGTVFINNAARGSLIADGGAVDQIFAGSIESSRKLALEAVRTLDFATAGLPARIARRRTDAIRDYPWRDDALRVWNGIADFVGRYVQHYYADAAALAADGELLAWSALLGRPFEQGGVAGFVPPQTPAALADALTLIIYTASAGHAAVNFPQYPDMSYAPVVSGAGWRRPPAAGEAPAAGDLAFFPPLDLAVRQAELLYLLGSVHHTQLGAYQATQFKDREVAESIVPRFAARLASVEAEIRAANASGTRTAYEHLLPSLVPQSINI